MDRETARICLTNGGRRTTKEEIDRFLVEMKAGVPVMPVTFVCAFLEEWAELASKPVADAPNADYNLDRVRLGQIANELFLQIKKSNLLNRRIYCGEPVRKRPCPVHKGRWSGCKLPEETGCDGACMSGSNVTGWLPEQK